MRTIFRSDDSWEEITPRLLENAFEHTNSGLHIEWEVNTSTQSKLYIKTPESDVGIAYRALQSGKELEENLRYTLYNPVKVYREVNEYEDEVVDEVQRVCNESTIADSYTVIDSTTEFTTDTGDVVSVEELDIEYDPLYRDVFAELS